MSTVQNIQSSQSLNLSAGVNNAAKTNADDPQDRFLKLLVTQMKNQDPLNPLDNAQVTSQLAQISTVNGIEKLNQTMQAMGSSLAAGQSLQAASMIGRDVLVPGSTLRLAGEGALFGIDLGQAADQVKVSISDASGRAVRVLDLGAQAAGPLTLAWDGKTSDGVQATDGDYSVSISALRGGQKVDAQTLASATVNGVTQSDQGVRLNVGTLGSVGLSDIKQIF
ncbi:flagellar hook assembly protein FlgD [Nitrosovibrio tenuis]|uniref:Basal-body rod modification protein FlgD n=1 Tax=Nitrosovibrio tenuis TaxID=1233 RepID=A0A1H7J6R5_9PROT|nr:flagellar hook assembly protein FlgD [Nitrosovibrio tenuis]SEK70378.1 flagellar basal-body rod modification protein FlgD [Nitrosovibrio tenuis]